MARRHGELVEDKEVRSRGLEVTDFEGRGGLGEGVGFDFGFRVQGITWRGRGRPGFGCEGRRIANLELGQLAWESGGLGVGVRCGISLGWSLW